MKKALSLLLLISLLLTCFVGCGEQPNPASDFEYTVDSEKNEIIINKYIGTSKSVVIPAEIENMPVVAIDGIPIAPDSNEYEGVFYNTGVVTVVIPKTVRRIGFSSFTLCDELTQVIFKKDSSLLYIANGAFSGCVNLEKIDFSSTELKVIGMYAFKGCSSLKEVILPETLETIYAGAFYECSSLTDIKLPNNLTTVEEQAFAYCTSLKRINIPAKMDLFYLSVSLFHNVPALSQIVFDEGREKINGYAMIIQTADIDIEVIIPKSVNKFSPLPFLFNSPSKVTLRFLGDAPEIIEEPEPYWLERVVVLYDAETSGWESFEWKDKVEMKEYK